MNFLRKVRPSTDRASDPSPYKVFFSNNPFAEAFNRCPAAAHSLLFVAALVAAFTFSTNIYEGVTPFVEFTKPFALPIMVLLTVASLLFSSGFRLNWLLVAFCLEALISTIIAFPPACFHPFERWALFVVLLCLLSPLVESGLLARIRRVMWYVSLFMLRSLVVIAAFWSPFFDEFGYNYTNYGLTYSPNLFAVMAAIIVIDSTWRLLHSHMTLRIRACFFVLLVMAIVSLLSTGSRTGCVAAIVGVVPLFWRIVVTKRAALLGTFAVVIACAASVVALNMTPICSLAVKMHKDEGKGSLIISRSERWNARLDEATENPLTGIGFCANTRFSNEYDEDFIDEQGNIERSLEPGSSWLSVLACTGILGAIIMAAFIVQTCLRVLSRIRRGSSSAILYAGLLVALLVDGVSEGWMLFGGSYIFFIFWLLTGMIYDERE